MFVCPHCIQDPSLHSFRVESDTETHTTYHSRIEDSTDTDVPRILSHIEGYLEYQSVHHPKKTWSWVVDGTDFTMKWHSLELTTEIFKAVQKYQSTFRGCRVKNTNWWIRDLFGLCQMFLNQEIKDLLVME